MREIKFRAWDTETKEMSHDFLSKNWLKVCIESPYVELMQYTGLKDKNGVEIYEGDVLKCQLPVEIMDNGCHAIDGETIIAKVVYEDGCFMAEGKTVEYPWVLDGDKTILSWLCKINAYGRYQTTVEIIGNIYENSELLGGR